MNKMSIPNLFFLSCLLTALSDKIATIILSFFFVDWKAETSLLFQICIFANVLVTVWWATSQLISNYKGE